MKRLAAYLSLIYLISFAHGLYAAVPLRQIYGTVVDAEGGPIAGAAVVLEGKPDLGGE